MTLVVGGVTMVVVPGAGGTRVPGAVGGGAGLAAGGGGGGGAIGASSVFGFLGGPCPSFGSNAASPPSGAKHPRVGVGFAMARAPPGVGPVVGTGSNMTEISFS